MKTQYIKSAIVIVCLLLSFNTMAYDFESGGVYYTIISSSELKINVTYKSNYSGNIIIPETVEYNRVYVN